MRKTYFVEAEQVGIGKRVVRAILALSIFVIATYIVHVIWFPRKLDSWDYGLDAVVAVGTDLYTRNEKSYEIEVGDDEIQMRSDGSLLKRIRKGHIRRVYEIGGDLFREPALRISESGPIATFFRGCVVIPARLPEYEQIKALAMSWMAIG